MTTLAPDQVLKTYFLVSAALVSALPALWMPYCIFGLLDTNFMSV